MKTFNDIKFKLHPNGMGGILGQMDLDNGYKISVVGGGRGLYGDGKLTLEKMTRFWGGKPRTK